MSTVIASQLVFADPTRTGAGEEDPDILISRTAERLHPRSHEALAEHIGDLRVSAPGDVGDLPIPPLPLLQSSGTVTAHAQRIIETATRAWSIILRTDRERAVSAQYAVRAAAALLADHCDGVGVDLAIPRVWPSLSPDDDPDRTADWFLLERSEEDARVTTTTRGLSRFGVPELRVAEIAASEVPAWDAVLTGLAHRLVKNGPGDPPERVELGLRDIAAGYAEPVDAGDPTLARVTTVELAYDGEIAEISGAPVPDLFG